MWFVYGQIIIVNGVREDERSAEWANITSNDLILNCDMA